MAKSEAAVLSLVAQIRTQLLGPVWVRDRHSFH
jgi:hypothetical protein